MGLYTRRMSLWQRRQQGLQTTSIGPTDPEDFVEPVGETKLETPVEKIVKIDSGIGKVVERKIKHEKK